jgi:hypothetical protein
MEANVPLYRAEADTIINALIGRGQAVVEIETVPRNCEPVLLITLAVDGFQLRLIVEDREARHPPRKDFGQKLRSRIEEAQAQGAGFLERIADVRSKLRGSLARNGGMKLVSLGMAAANLKEPFHWFETLLEARVEALDGLLAPENVVIQDFTARGMAGTIRSIGADHQRRTRIREHLASIGAVYEIDLAAEQAIVDRGCTVREVAQSLARRRSVRIEDDKGGTIDVGLTEGRICLYSMLDNRAKRRPVMLHEVRSEGKEVAA